MGARGTPNVWLRAGLIEAKHRKTMGEAVWLYLYLHLLVRFDGPDAGSTGEMALYKHEEAADVLGWEERQVRRHFQRLVDGGYVVAERRQRGLAFRITKYATGEARKTRSQGTPDRTHLSDQKVPKVDTDVRSEPIQTGHICPPDRTHLSMRSDISAPPTNKDARAADESNDTDVVPPPAPQGAKAAPKPNKSGEVIDLLRAEELPDALSPRDHAAIKRSALSPTQIVTAFGAAFRGEWGNGWLRDNLAVWAVLDRYAGYQASLKGAPSRRATPAKSASSRLDRIEEEQLGGRDDGPRRVGFDLGLPEVRGGLPRQFRG